MRYFISISLAIILSILILPFSIIQAGEVENFTICSICEDAWYNYDGESSSYDADNVDWPINMLFYNNANVGKVMDIYWGGAWPASNMYLYCDDGGGWVVDSETGSKSGDILTPTRYHMRIYADDGYRMYNTSYGYYCIASIHKDVNEGLPYAEYGWSEDMEDYVCDYADNEGYTVYEDYSSYGNQIYEWQGNHYYQSNGYASAVNVT